MKNEIGIEPITLNLYQDLLLLIGDFILVMSQIFFIWGFSSNQQVKHTIVYTLPMSYPFINGDEYGIRTRYFIYKPLSGLTYYFQERRIATIYLLFGDIVLIQLYN